MKAQDIAVAIATEISFFLFNFISFFIDLFCYLYHPSVVGIISPSIGLKTDAVCMRQLGGGVEQVD